MALTAREVELIQSSFAKVEPIADTAAAIFYKTLFQYDPNLKPLFKGDMKQQGRKPKDKDGNVFDFRVELTPVHDEINKIIDKSKKLAEERLRRENPQIAESIFAQRKINRLMEQGRIDEANQYADQQNPNNRTEQIQQFSQYR